MHLYDELKNEIVNMECEFRDRKLEGKVGRIRINYKVFDELIREEKYRDKFIFTDGAISLDGIDIILTEKVDKWELKFMQKA